MEGLDDGLQLARHPIRPRDTDLPQEVHEPLLTSPDRRAVSRRGPGGGHDSQAPRVSRQSSGSWATSAVKFLKCLHRRPNSP
eukprot:5903440-Pyramimonas_sp.AAC.1